MEPQVTFHIEVKLNPKDAGELILCVVSLKRSTEDIVYLIPRGLQEESLHGALFKLPQVSKAVKNLTEIGQYRNLRITLRDPVRKFYMDADENFVFADEYLEEAEVTVSAEFKNKGTASSSVLDPILKTEFMQLMESLKMEKSRKSPEELPEHKLNTVGTTLSIEKFNAKQKAKD